MFLEVRKRPRGLDQPTSFDDQKTGRNGLQGVRDGDHCSHPEQPTLRV
jgi:hypothetical protein